MKQQILLIHGGNAFDTYEEYLTYLKNKELTLSTIRYVDWKKALGDVLGPEYEIIAPQMPNNQNAKYLEWEIWFNKVIPLLNDSVILVGHSMGGIFLAKYLSENTLSRKIRATFLVAAPYNTATKDSIADFILSEDLSKLSEQSEKIILYHSKDDPIVPFSNVLEYQKNLPTASIKVFDDKGHFNQTEFPEIVEDIRAHTKLDY